MAGADTACVSTRAGTILGLVRSFAPVLRSRAAPGLRVLVPGLLALFLVTFALGAWYQIGDSREETIASAIAELDVVAALTASTAVRPGFQSESASARLTLLVRSLPASASGNGRHFYWTDELGAVLASYPASPGGVRTLSDLFGDGQPITMFADRAGVMRVKLADKRDAIATVRKLSPSGEQIAVIQPVSSALAGWRGRTIGVTLLLAAAAAVAAALGAGYSAQAGRARAATGECAALKRRIDSALSRGRCGLWDWDIARGRIYWSDSMYELLGYERRSEFLSFGEVEALVHPDDGDLYRLADRLAAASASTVEQSFRMRSASGSWVWLRARAEISEEEPGAGARLLGIAVDISDQRRSAEQSAKADARLRDAVDAISEAFVLWDSENRLVLCNSKFQELNDLPPEFAIPGKPYHEVMRDSRPRVVHQQPVGETRGEAGCPTFEAQLADGRWLQINERRTKDGGYVSVGADITALKRHQEQLVRSERQLIETVDDLKRSRQTLEVQTQQLADLAERYLEQKAQAESANRAKSEFLANMSHELRTPLNAIIGFAEIMESGIFGGLGSEKYDEYCRDIRSSGNYLLSLINDMLDMSRIEAGRMRLSTKEIEVDLAIKKALVLVTEMARAKNLELTVHTLPDATVPADERALQQILVNLLENAVKFTPAGGHVSVRTRSAGDAINIYVEDRGIGIPREALAKLGRPFEQVENEASRSRQGSGLGLAIARSLSELHGGGLRIRSQPGVGTIVLVHLPRGPASATHEGPDTVH